jgi:hypothetical protein
MKAAELFDELLDLSVSYPRTLACLFLGRSAHFHQAAENRCPPGAFAVITFALLYLAAHTVPAAQGRDLIPLPEWLKPDLALAFLFAAIGVLVNTQLTLLRRAFTDFRPVSKDAVLAYPYCATLLLFAAVRYQSQIWIVLLVHAFYVWSLFTVLRAMGVVSLPRALLGALVAYAGFLALAAITSLLFVSISS